MDLIGVYDDNSSYSNTERAALVLERELCNTILYYCGKGAERIQAPEFLHNIKKCVFFTKTSKEALTWIAPADQRILSKLQMLEMAGRDDKSATVSSSSDERHAGEKQQSDKSLCCDRLWSTFEAKPGLKRARVHSQPVSKPSTGSSVTLFGCSPVRTAKKPPIEKERRPTPRGVELHSKELRNEKALTDKSN